MQICISLLMTKNKAFEILSIDWVNYFSWLKQEISVKILNFLGVYLLFIFENQDKTVSIMIHNFFISLAKSKCLFNFLFFSISLFQATSMTWQIFFSIFMMTRIGFYVFNWVISLAKYRAIIFSNFIQSDFYL